MGSESLGASLIDTLRHSSAIDVVADFGEIGVDAITTGPLREVPIIGSLLGVWRAGVQVRDMVFVRKLCRFLQGLESVDPKDRERFADNLERDPKLRSRIGENLLLVLDRLDDMEKPELLARAFSLMMRGEIPYSQLSEFALAIDRCLVSDLVYLRGTDSKLNLPSSAANRLSACGLVEQYGPSTIDDIDGELRYGMTSLGRQFYQRVVNEKGRASA